MEAIHDPREVLLTDAEGIGDLALGPPGPRDSEPEGGDGSAHDPKSSTWNRSCQVVAQAGAQLLEHATVDSEPDPEEAARRLRAAIAYVGIGYEEAAKTLGVSIPTLARMLGRKGRDRMRPATWGELWRFADALGLPKAWFTADIAQLHNIVPDDLPSFPNDTGARFDGVRPSEAERRAAQAREEQELQKEAQRARERRKASRDTKRSRRRRRNEDG